VQSKKAQKIDLTAHDYPCPCRCQGRLQPILLTEAFGCDRCQKIFAVEENGYVLQQVSTSSPYKKTWYWTGKQWIAIHSDLKEYYLPVGLLVILVLPIVWLSLYFLLAPSGSSIMVWVFIPVMLLLLLALMRWLVYRRSS